MSDAFLRRFTRARVGGGSRARTSMFLATLVVATFIPATAAVAITVPTGFTAIPFATAPTGASGPDDLTVLYGNVFVGYQNGVPSSGPGPTGPRDSTLVEYTATGRVLGSWSLLGKIDGLAADKLHGRVIVTANEDHNSTLYTVTPRLGLPARVLHYTYSPDPGSAGTGGLFTGGGTDAVTVLPDGTILTSASNPNDDTSAAGPNPTATATFEVTLKQVGTKFTAMLSPTFPDNAQATNALTSKTVTLGSPGAQPGGLTDPDSNAYVPASSPRFAGEYVLDGQADQQLVFASHIQAGPFGPATLTELPLSHTTGSATVSAGVDDIRWIGGPLYPIYHLYPMNSTMYAVDNGGGPGGKGIVYAITGPFQAGQVYAALDTVGSAANNTEMDNLNLTTGLLTKFATGFTTIKGLAWVRSSDPLRR